MRIKLAGLLVLLSVLLFSVPAAMAGHEPPEDIATVTIVNQTASDWTFWMTSHSPAALVTQFSVHKGATVTVNVPSGAYDYNLERAGGLRRLTNQPLTLNINDVATITIEDDKQPRVTASVVAGDPPSEPDYAAVHVVNKTAYDWTFYITTHSPAKLVNAFSVHAGASVWINVAPDQYDFSLERAAWERVYLNRPLRLEKDDAATITIEDAKAPRITVALGDRVVDTIEYAHVDIINKTAYDWTFWITNHSPAALAGAFSVHANQSLIDLIAAPGHYDFNLVRADGDRRWVNSPLWIDPDGDIVITIVDDKAPKVTVEGNGTMPQ